MLESSNNNLNYSLYQTPQTLNPAPADSTDTFVDFDVVVDQSAGTTESMSAAAGTDTTAGTFFNVPTQNLLSSYQEYQSQYIQTQMAVDGSLGGTIFLSNTTPAQTTQVTVPPGIAVSSMTINPNTYVGTVVFSDPNAQTLSLTFPPSTAGITQEGILTAFAQLAAGMSVEDREKLQQAIQAYLYLVTLKDNFGKYNIDDMWSFKRALEALVDNTSYDQTPEEIIGAINTLTSNFDPNFIQVAIKPEITWIGQVVLNLVDDNKPQLTIQFIDETKDNKLVKQSLTLTFPAGWDKGNIMAIFNAITSLTSKLDALQREKLMAAIQAYLNVLSNMQNSGKDPSRARQDLIAFLQANMTESYDKVMQQLTQMTTTLSAANPTTTIK